MYGSKINFSRIRYSLSLVLLGAVIASCTVTETPISESPVGSASGEPSVGVTPPVRLPSLRLSRRNPVDIATLTEEQNEDTVSVVAKVTQRAALLEGWLYELEDDTGTIWVITQRSEPQIGEQVTVEAIVRHELIAVGEIQSGELYLEETAYRVETE